MSVCLSVCLSPERLLCVKLQSSNLAIKFLISISRKLPTRFLKFCLGAEIFDLKDDKKWDIFLTCICLYGRQLMVGHETSKSRLLAEMGPDPTRAYFDPQQIRAQPAFDSGTFWSEEKKIEKFDIFRENFPNSNQNHKWLTQPNPGQKILTLTHHFLLKNLGLGLEIRILGQLSCWEKMVYQLKKWL